MVDWADTQLMNRVATALNDRVAMIADTAAVVASLLAEHGYWSAKAGVAAALHGSQSWSEAWAASLRDRAAALDGLESVEMLRLDLPAVYEQLRRGARYAGSEPDPLSFAAWEAKQAALAETKRRRLEDTIAAFTQYAVIAYPETAEGTAAFFANLDAADAAHLARLHPEIIGPMAGAPLELRFLANRILIARTRDQLNTQLSDLRAGRVESFAELNRITEIEREIDILTGLLARERRFVLFDWQGAGRVAEWHGPAAAENVVVYVPGTTHSKLTIDGLNDRSRLMVEHDPSGGDLAVITAMIYDAPDTVIPEAALGLYADAGGPLLVGFVDGLHLNDRHLTILAHSYGSTTAGEALHTGLADTLGPDDDIVFVGSPGVRYDTVSDIPHPVDHVWVGLTEGDEIQAAVSPAGIWETFLCRGSNTLFGGLIALAPYDAPSCDISEKLAHGANPASASFGAQVFATGPNLPPDGFGTEHGEYWKLDIATGHPTMSLANLLAISIGDYAAVTLEMP